MGINNISWINKFKQIEESSSNLPSDLSINQKILRANWEKSLGGYNLYFNYNKSLKDEYLFNSFLFELNGEILKNLYVDFKSSVFENTPNFNYVLFNSAYSKYNWYNDNLKNQKVRTASINLSYNDLLKISGEYSEIDNYTYFKETTNELTGEIENKRFASVERKTLKLNTLKLG